MKTESQSIVGERAVLAGETQSAILRTMLYFDIFDYSLTAFEIFENCQGHSCTLSEVVLQLQALEASGLICRTKKFYHLKKRQAIVDSRAEMNLRAEKLFPVARRISKLISYFPFVEGIFITGSLAKNCMYSNSDIDYFIITKPGRLWLCRGLLTAFKKIFLLNSKKYFCVNYYVDSESLAIPDKNIFTATEIIFARATFNPVVCGRFFTDNQWIYDYYPNKFRPGVAQAAIPGASILKSFFEKLFAGFAGEKADELFFRMFVNRWKKKFGHLPSGVFEINFRSRRNISKHHPNGYQIKILSELKKRIHKFELENNMKLQ